eukprot:scpid90923/ scgid4582/ MAM and LDL-receptor class A domain-containing protein C10orf112
MLHQLIGALLVLHLHLADCYDSCPLLHSANFESGTSGLSGYTQLTNDDFNWKRNTSTTTTWYTGPSSDHTYGNKSGHYFYIEDHDGKNGDTATLRSPLLMSTDLEQECYLQFWYNMRGSNIGSLSVYLRDQGATTGSLLWQRSGDQCTSTSWRLGIARLKRSNAKNFYLLFQGKTVYKAIGNTGDIAIDDITVHCCAGCSASNILSLAEFTTTWNGYTQSKSDNFDWTRKKASTSTSATGPAYDITKGYPGCYPCGGFS